MTQLKSLAHPEWPYTGTPNEWRGFARAAPLIVPADFEITEEMRRELEKPGFLIYQNQNFGPELP